MLYSTSVIGLALARPNALLARQLGGWSHTVSAHASWAPETTWAWRLTKNEHHSEDIIVRPSR